MTECDSTNSDRPAAGGENAKRKLGRLPSLDGWRAISIFMVLLAHSPLMPGFPKEWEKPFERIFDGNLGVRFFFLISGFLITWLMFKEQRECGAVNLRLFYVRRALRILPVCFVYLLVILLLSFVTPFKQDGGIWLANISFTTNFLLDRNWHGVPSPSIHLWSLAIEEQFYLIWPPMFCAIGVLQTWRFWIQLVFVSLLIAPMARVVSIYELYSRDWGWLFSPASFLNYFDSIAYGCVCAFLMATQQQNLRKLVRDYRGAFFLLCLAAVLTPHVLRHYKSFKMLVIAFGPTVQAIGFAGLLIQSVIIPEWGLYRALNWPLACFTGTLSFSIYIWQQLFCSPPETFGLSNNSIWMSFPFGWLFAGAVALLSYYMVERPFMSLRAKLRPLD
jgi:peptidoglycan/LPS O-acetylase OafA/YrhL